MVLESEFFSEGLLSSLQFCYCSSTVINPCIGSQWFSLLVTDTKMYRFDFPFNLFPIPDTLPNNDWKHNEQQQWPCHGQVMNPIEMYSQEEDYCPVTKSRLVSVSLFQQNNFRGYPYGNKRHVFLSNFWWMNCFKRCEGKTNYQSGNLIRPVCLPLQKWKFGFLG